MVNGIRGQSYPTLGIWSLCPWTPVTLLSSPSYPTFTSKDILELRGRLPHILDQQKITLRQIRRRCVLTHETLNLCPLRPVHPELHPLRPVRPELRPLRPLRPVRPELCFLRPVPPELPGNARSNFMRPEFPRNAGSHPMPPRPRCTLLCVRIGGCLMAAS